MTNPDLLTFNFRINGKTVKVRATSELVALRTMQAMHDQTEADKRAAARVTK